MMCSPGATRTLTRGVGRSHVTRLPRCRETVAHVPRLQELDSHSHGPAPGLFGLLAEQRIALAHGLDKAVEPQVVEMGADVQPAPAVPGGDALQMDGARQL